MDIKTLSIWGIGVAIFLVVGGFLVWFLLFTSPGTPAPAATNTGSLSTGGTQTVGTPISNTAQPTNQTSVITQSAAQTVFKIANGPVTGATFVQTFSPTTTLARYTLQENGHVLDQPIDVPGSLPRPVSNTTIPGTERALWAEDGSTLLLQYLEGTAVKTVSLVFPATGPNTATKPVQIQFLPDNVSDVAISPDAKQLAYLLPTASGVDGYIANTDGSNAKKLFSLGFSELLLSWPSANTLLLSTKSAAGIPGIVFSVQAKTGGIVPLIYALGITANANPSFTNILYLSDPPGKDAPAAYAHNVAKGGDIRLSFNPIPEKCAWSATKTNVVYCATPDSYFGISYLDLWHQGTASLSDSITKFMLDQLPNTSIVATPGSSDGGETSDIEEIAVSPDDHYLLFVKKGDRSLWGVRLSQ